MPKMEMGKYSKMNKFNIGNRRYLGSKAKLIPFIKKVVEEECSNINSVLDLFGGTGNVAWSFNNRDTSVIINDILESNYISYLAWFGNQEIDKSKIQDLVEAYNSSNPIEDNYFSVNFADTFFSLENCRKIGYIRDDIETKYSNKSINEREKAILVTSLIYSMDRIANTVGHYDAYRLNGDLNKKMELELLEIPEKEINLNNKIYHEDANTLVKKVSADLVYIDPPYNSRQYSDAYHLLENVTMWKKPKVYGVAKKMDRSNIKSKYCTHNAASQFEDLIKNINAKYILVSYNNMGNKGSERSQAKISDDEIVRSLSSKGKVSIYETDFNQFTTGKTEITNHKERLFLCKVGEGVEEYVSQSQNDGYVKSPLNYTGGKHKLLDQLIERFPNKFSTFIDLFAGGFNVGVNINADLIVYNDKNKEVYRILKLFFKYDYSEIIKRIEKNIKTYNLSNTFEQGYEFYNCNSDSGVGNYNKTGYSQMRDKYNSIVGFTEEKDFLLLSLIIFSFNNQIRFNSNGEYNMPVGKRDLNASTRNNIKEFSIRIRNKNIIFENKSFEKMSISTFNDPFVYCDPPYLLGLAAYNENNGWTEKDEMRLLDYLENISKNNISFALSNVIEHRGKTNNILKLWAEKNHFNLIYIKANYNNSNYQIKNKNSITREVLITNY
jgi:adenine-specific DNA-methyltransferase